ncbi:hypothetical protein [Nocardioides bigeumensis]|uniref:Uncharacterized protein n=1 Tax=Nocardioides bigeumensis TaxID=433657 RepID=A0ABN2YV07_9ACTN
MKQKRNLSPGRPAARAQHLYHYTRAEWADSILREGVIRTTVPNLRPPTDLEEVEVLLSRGFVQIEAGSPSVVWLTSEDRPGSGDDHGLPQEKRAVRIAVDVGAQPWNRWAPRQKNYDKQWVRHLGRVGGGKSSTWHVHTNPIAMRDVVEVRDLITNHVLYSRGAE